MNYVLGIDIGTSGVKTILFSTDGIAAASSTIEYPVYYPRNGWAEQDPKDWWEASVKSIREVIEQSGVNSCDIIGVGLSGQMHGLVMIDEQGEVLRQSIIWCDQRTAKECEEITRLVGHDRLVEITANPALTGFTASKILWVRNHEPDIYNKCKHILLPKDYIRFKLTGEFATEVSDASGMQLLDVKNRCWSGEVLDKLGIDRNLLGKVYESPDITGYIHKEAAKLTGLKEGTLVVGGAGDNAAAAIGTGVVSDGKAFTTIGSSGVVYAHTSQINIDAKGRVHTFCCAVPGEWHVMGVTQGAGLSLKWFKNNFCHEETEQAKKLNSDPYTIMDAEAERIPLGSERLIYLPYLMGERTPHLDPDCRGVFFGLSAMHTRAHAIRAIMEGVGFSLKECCEVIKGMGIEISDMMICGGGGRSSLWRQILSDMYGCPVKTPVLKDGPALGAAILAAVGAGAFVSVAEGCSKMIAVESVQYPDSSNSIRYEDYYALYKDIYRCLEKSYKTLAKL